MINRYIVCMSDRAYDPERLATLFHYVISRVGSHAGFGATKLYKVAWFSDARQFMLKGKSITGAEYIKEEFGPIPKMGKAIRDQLQERGDVKEWRDTGLFGEPWKFKSLNSPNVTVFSDEELNQIDYWTNYIDKNHTASSISEESHDYGWEIAKIKEPLPFIAFSAHRVRQPNSKELEWAKGRLNALGIS
jgi:hypothetical protein